MFIFQSPVLIALACYVLPAMIILGGIFAMSLAKSASDADDVLLGDRQYRSD